MKADNLFDLTYCCFASLSLFCDTLAAFSICDVNDFTRDLYNLILVRVFNW